MSKKQTDGVVFEAKWSKNAKEKELVRISEGGTKIVFPLENLVQFVVQNFNVSSTAPLVVKNNMVQLVQVERQLRFKADRDIKEGEEFNVNFTHTMPLEYAMAEHSLNLCRVSGDVKIETIPESKYREMFAEIDKNTVETAKRLNKDKFPD